MGDQRRIPLLADIWEGNSLKRQNKSSKASTILFTPFSGPAGENFTFPHEPDCGLCRRPISAQEARQGVGLCLDCLDKVPKDCLACKGKLARQQLRWGSGLCDDCYDRVDKACKFCNVNLQPSQLRWQTGLCDKCWDKHQNQGCFQCRTPLSTEQLLHWGSGLCDPCYDKSERQCKGCNLMIPNHQRRFGTSLCNQCYDKTEKGCRQCGERISLGALHWRSRLCDPCWDKGVTNCIHCKKELVKGNASLSELSSGLCGGCFLTRDKTCKNCYLQIPDENLSWGTGLCDVCYDACHKQCNACTGHISLGGLHWRSGLCNSCYDKAASMCKDCKEKLTERKLSKAQYDSGLCGACYEKRDQTCTYCKGRIKDESLHWGSGLCDSCYNKCEKDCAKCRNKISLRQLHWNSRICDQCYDGSKKHCLQCKERIHMGDLRWGSNLCNVCYDGCSKSCQHCSNPISFGELQYVTGLCNSCYDEARGASTESQSTTGIWTVIFAQFVFYMAPGMLIPSLYLRCKYLAPASASGFYALVLSIAMCVSMVMPLALGPLADLYGVRRVYLGVVVMASAGALTLTVATSPLAFGIAWGVLAAPPALRGVRAAYFAKASPPDELSRFSQLSSAFGLLGGLIGPLLASVLRYLRVAVEEGEQDMGVQHGRSLPTSFAMAATLASMTHLLCSIFLQWYLPAPEEQQTMFKCPYGRKEKNEILCETCAKKLNEDEMQYATQLCNTCYDGYGGVDINFIQFKRQTLLVFCTVVCLLEFSENCAIIATFQPIVVTYFKWQSDKIALVNLAGAGLSVLVSFGVAHFRLPEKKQLTIAAFLYVISVWLYTVPPLTEWRLILGLMLGIKSQILFMAPFTAIFSQLIGRVRVTNSLTTPLVLAPLVGATAGTMLAPFAVAAAGRLSFVLVAVPASLAALGMLAGRDWFDPNTGRRPSVTSVP